MTTYNNICDLCSQKYPDEMIIDKKYCDFNQCYDCLFSMNFNDIKIINGSMGIKLSEYLNISSKYHALINELPCNRLSDSGGCYVCMKLLDIPFDTPTDKKEQPTQKEQNKTKQLYINTDSTYKSHDIKIDDNIFIDNNLILSL